MAWDYAELSKEAKKVGGPEKLVDLLFESGRDAGHKEMLPLVSISMGIGALLCAGISKLVKILKNKKRISPKAVEEAKSELIKGIEEYDATHSEENKDNVIEKEEENNE